MQARTFIYGSNFGSISKGRMAKSRCKMTTLWVPRSMGNLPCIKTYGIIFCQHGIFVNYNEPGYWPTFFSAHGEPATGPGVCPLPPTNENLARKNFRGLYMWTSDDWPPKNMMVSTTQKWECTKTSNMGIFHRTSKNGARMGSDIPTDVRTLFDISREIVLRFYRCCYQPNSPKSWLSTGLSRWHQ